MSCFTTPPALGSTTPDLTTHPTHTPPQPPKFPPPLNKQIGHTRELYKNTTQN